MFVPQQGQNTHFQLPNDWAHHTLTLITLLRKETATIFSNLNMAAAAILNFGVCIIVDVEYVF